MTPDLRQFVASVIVSAAAGFVAAVLVSLAVRLIEAARRRSEAGVIQAEHVLAMWGRHPGQPAVAATTRRGDPDHVDPDSHWWQGPCVCSICGHEQRSVIEIPRDCDMPFVPMECGNCGNMTSNPDLDA